MAKQQTQQDSGELDEAWLDQLRRDPTVVVHKRTNFEPFVSKIRVEKPVDVLELIGRYDDDEPDDDDSGR